MNKKIKLSLLSTLIAGSALAITLPIVSCSSANQYLLTLIYAQGQDQKTLDAAATKILQDLIINEPDQQAKENLIKQWKRNSSVPNELRTEIFKIISFNDINKNPIPENDAVEKVIFASEIVDPTGKENIDGPTVRIILKKDYTIPSPIDIKIHELKLNI
ncbi:MAG: hypothetical protein ACRDCD_02785 [Mycoplasmoidaceae bacterium]